ncbi:bax inhibitor 1 [Selaginella moellendorffii]|uniref:bax inhibitor 1 n=1 Tax=Selaginella moellendorffii TaxID=88036 RepID=UPI000D1C63C2|nr:bax inhibitor 1 [Selaginella moellendorffii]|eukprot:XP_002969696.2 bax inhibitor 1 [Selaginella moellendorffii]
MDFFERSSSWNYGAMKNFHRISEPVKRHVRQVYWTVAMALIVSAVGVYAHMLLNIGGLLTTFGFLGCSFALMNTSSSYAAQGKRWTWLMAAAFCEGASLGNFVGAVIEFDPSILVTAFVATVAVFASFSGAALLAKRREFMFLGGILASAASSMLTLHFLSSFFGGAALMFEVELYGGLLLVVGYVIFDTQLIIERAERGDMDHIKHALDLFVDFVGIFVRVLYILTRKAAERESREKRRNRQRHSSRY